MKRQLLFIVLMLLPMMASADAVEINGIYYNLDETTKQAAVAYTNQMYTKYKGSVEIPEVVSYDGVDYSVTSIEARVFVRSFGLTSITIPSSVTNIGENAFDRCDGLAEVHIKDLEAWFKIDFASAYSNPISYARHLFLNGEEVKDLVVPNGVTSIKNFAFFACNSLTSVTIPNSVTSIGSCAFFACNDLTSVSLSNSLTSIGESSFCSTSLTSVTIPDGVTSIEHKTFYECSGLTSVTIPNSVTDIGTSAFGYSGLTSVTIPNGVKTIGEDAFYQCLSLTSIVIPNSVTSIGIGAFRSCNGLTSIVVEDGNSVYDSREGCNALIKTSDNELITGCMNTTIPNSVTAIGPNAFFGCSGLTSVTIPNSVTDIGTSAFGYSGLTSVTIPNGVKTIGEDAFYQCLSLTSIVIPNSVTSIGIGVFSGCSGLTSVTIPNSVTAIGVNAFARCSGLTSVTIPNSVTSIELRAFAFCSGLTSVTIGNSVVTIGRETFAQCSKLETVCCLAEDVPSTGKNAFDGQTIKDATLFVPESSLNDYMATAPWSQFGTFKTIGDTFVKPLGNDTPVSIKSNGGQLTIEGADDGLQVRVYGMNGVEAGSGVSSNGQATVNTNLQPGSVAVIKIGDKSVKVATK